MRKISSTTELQNELQRLVVYSQSDRPSRTSFAHELHSLSVRVAAENSEAALVLDAVERRLKSKFQKLKLLRDEDHEYGSFSLTVEPKHREPDSSIVVISVSDDAESSSVSVHNYGSGSSSSSGPDFDGANATKLTDAAIKLIEKYVEAREVGHGSTLAHI